MTLDDTLLAAGEGMGKHAATLKAVSTLLRGKPLQGGCVLLSGTQRDQLCDLVDEAAEIFDELSIAVELDTEALQPDGDEETRL